MIIVADLGPADKKPDEFVCGICGFVMNEAGECPRCKMQVRDDAERRDQHKQLGDEIERFFRALQEPGEE